MDLAAFSDAGFDPKAYINAACAAKQAEEPGVSLERFLAELEMKLHLSAEDVGLYLQDHSARAQQRIPAAAKELLRIQDDVGALRASAAGALAQLQAAGGGAAAGVVAQLAELDRVKRRMEEACSTLKEAAGLSALFTRVDDLFASGDLGRVADALAGMRRGLAVVGDSVAEFRGGRDRLARLEERFAASVEGPLTAAFAQQQGEEAARLAGMLEAVGRGDAAERLYCAARLPALQRVWDAFTAGTPFASWLPSFYEQVVHVLAGEAAWCAGALPARSQGLPLALLGALLSKIEKPFKQRLGVAMAATTGSVLPLEHLEQVQAASAEFAAAAFRALGGTGATTGSASALDAAGFAATHARILAPAEEALLQYGDRELAYLTAELARIGGRGATQAGAEGGAAALEESIAPALAACDAALGRCLKLTGGTALPVLARVLDRALQQYVAAAQAAVAAIRSRLAELDAAQDAGAEGAEAVLPLLTVASQLVQQLAALEASLRAAAAEAAPPLLEVSTPGAASTQAGQLPSAAELRLRAQPIVRQQLAGFAANAADGAPLLPLARAAASELEQAVGGCVLEALGARPRAQLAQLLRLPEWQQRSAAGALPLPTFSSYPLQYITSVGEYLMMLPQQLEGGLLRGGGGEEGEEAAGQLVADWIDRVALDAAAAYQAQLAALPGLSPQGAAQLAADLEYFANVLGTLGVVVPPSLAAWQAATGAPPEGLPAVAEAAAQGGDPGAQQAVQLVARLRGLQLAGGAPAQV